ncbi:uncharacterized protein Pyn_25010 [Prunus yedoensis var. nudiflora]|uniref:Aminotransferase-like plant mobile domain-containing protein n=1 Tax=Prunus yedoensis var. nudiflora TaxID=2094558 RepID=A0A314XSF9_PRUYE|nr:uncharacterized protein Pyn_25010 [Prunus yedoensis var. nudiflora]
MNLRFGMMTPTVLDMAALFGLSPLGVEVNAALVAPEAEGSFKAAWRTIAKLAGAKNMLNYSSFYNNFGVEDSADDDSIAPLGEVEHATFLRYWLCKFVFCTPANKAYFPELRGAVTIADTEPLANAFARAPRKHNTTTFCFKFFYDSAERTRSQFRVCLTRPFPLFLTHNLSVVLDGETENDLKEIWGSFLVARDLHCGLSKAGAEVYLPNFVARQFSLIQTAPLPPLSTNRLSSWRADVAQNHGMADISFQLQNGMTFLTLMPWRHFNAVDEEGRAWGKKAPAVPSRSSAQAIATSRAPTAASTTVPALRTTTAVVMPRTVPSPPPVRPSVAVGRKRGREAVGTEATIGEAVQAESVPAGEEDEVAIVETATAEAPDAEAAVMEALDDEAADA